MRITEMKKEQKLMQNDLSSVQINKENLEHLVQNLEQNNENLLE